jgi:hypothetical protein
VDEADFERAIARFLEETPIRWLLIAETFDDDMETQLWWPSSEDLEPWDMLGMMEWVVEGLRATARDVLEE